MSAPQTIAHYHIGPKLGEGGMGAVYRATDTKLGREVAIKVLTEAFAGDADRMARFTREARVLASLNHPNIAAIYGVEDRALVMELVEGDELRGPLPVETAIAYAKQIAAALDAAHEKGIVHRDLKPANIKVTPQGTIKVLDFGLAVTQPSNPVASGGPDNSPTLTAIGVTQAGMVLGTASYMSPEQAAGKPVDKRADIWSFGVVFYEMLTGERLFEGETISHTLAAVLTREPDLARVPDRVRRLLASCLEKDARKRLRDIADGWRLLEEEHPVAPTPLRRQIGWKAAAILASAVALGAIVLAWRASQPEPRPLLRLTAELGPDAASDPSITPVLSPDGSRLLFQENAGGGRDLAVLPLGQSKSLPVPGTANARFPFFSPDGEWIGFFEGTTLKKVRVQGGAAFTLDDQVPNPRGGDFLPDGSLVISPEAASGLVRIPAAGGKPEPLTDPPRQDQATHRWPQALPGGRYILFTANNSTNDFENAEIDLLDLKTGVWSAVVHGSSYGRFLPSGHLIYIHNGVLFAARFQPGRGRPPGPPVPLLDGGLALGRSVSHVLHRSAPHHGSAAQAGDGAYGRSDPVGVVVRKKAAEPRHAGRQSGSKEVHGAPAQHQRAVAPQLQA